MSTVKSFQELYDEFIIELQSQAPELTDTNDGSIIDIIAGTTTSAISEAMLLLVDEFRKTFFETAHGPEVTGGTDDLENLAVDHFGSTFARPEATKAIATVTFSRANTDNGDVTIGTSTIVKTAPNSSGVSQRFKVLSPVTMTGTTINASVEALTAGVDGNVLASKIVLIETSLTDPTVAVTNALAASGGAATQNDATYRETIRNLLQALRGATSAAIKAKALTVPGIVTATPVEFIQYVKEWNVLTSATVGDYFAIPRAILYVADANGTASAALIAAVVAAIESVRAAGVFIDVEPGVGVELDWTAEITLNPMGPNFAELSADPSRIIDTMTAYVQGLGIGVDFNRATANAAMLAIWGPAGSDDLTAFTTSIPSGNVSVADNEKLVAGDILI